MKLPKLPGLTGLRFFAAFLVFIFHVHERLQLTFLPLTVQKLISQGAIGVNCFFVLSGFILTYSYYQKNLSNDGALKLFIYKRLAKIYPTFIVGLLVYILIKFCFDKLNMSSLLPSLLNVTMLSSYFPTLAMKEYGGGAWSVSTEFFFYMCFPFLLPMLLNLKKKTLYRLLIIAVPLSAFSGYLYALLMVIGQKNTWFTFEFMYTFPLFRIGEFICGMIGGILVFKFNIKIQRWVVIGLFLFALLYLNTLGNLGFVSHNLVLIPFFICLMATLAQSKFDWMGSPTFVYLGNISYGFYIMQLPLMLLFDYLLQLDLVNFNRLLVVVCLFMVNIFLAMCCYHLVEEPAHRFLLKKVSI